MKKILLSLFICLCATLTISAQIQRTFFGLTLGVSTKSDVERFYKEHGVVFDENNNVINNVRFGGTRWGGFSCSLVNGILYQVIFMENELSSSKENVNIVWDNFSNALYSKYSQYYSNSLSKSESSTYIDEKTMIRISNESMSGYDCVGISYTDLELMGKKIQVDQNEL